MNTEQGDSNEQGNVIRQDLTIGDLVVRHPQVRPCLEKLGIDYCCGGNRLLREAVAEAGKEWPVVLAALEQALKLEQEDSEIIDWNAVPLNTLADHILEKHHTFTKEQLSRLDSLLTKVQKAHGAQHGVMLAKLRGVYDSLQSELKEHLMKEEQILFPAIKCVDAFVSGKGERPVLHCGSVSHPIRQMEHEHDSAGKALAEIRRMTDGYRLPSDGCQTFAALYDGLQALEADLHEHIHLENNILFPKSIAQEATMLDRELGDRK